MSEASAAERIWQVVASIPAGKVASYGQVAKLAGLPNGARQVGRVLSQLPRDTRLPWFRVINSQGRISFPCDSEGFIRQRQCLLEDQISVSASGKVSMQTYQWQP